MVSTAITPTRTIAVLIGVAVIAVAGFVVVRSGVFEPDSVQGAIPGPPSSSASPSPSKSESGSRSPMSSPKPSTPAQIKAKNIADAKGRLVQYYSTTAAVGRGGYKSWERELMPYWGHPDIRKSLREIYTGYAKKGDYTSGAASVESLRVTGYRPDRAGFETVKLRACVDFKQVKNFTKDSQRIPRQAGAPTRYQLDYAMRHQGIDSVWTINEQVPHPEQAC